MQIEEDRPFPPVMDRRDAARYLGLAHATLATLATRGGGPPFLRYSARCVRYRRADLDAWMAARVAVSTATVTDAERQAG